MDSNGSVMNRVQHRYWVTKQTFFRKLGKKEDEFIVSSDAELDAKLELFRSVQESSRSLLKIINQYQININTLALEETEMGYFMKGSGKQDKTRAGKMMVAVGTSVLHSGQQRFLLQKSLDRLHQKLETFHRRAIADTSQVIKHMEEARTEYRASLNWLKNISQELDPDTYKQLERFKKVQEHVKKSKLRFDHLKNICVTKIDVLVASRSNMFSNLLLHYEKSFADFTEKCVNTFSVITSSFKGYQHYDFCVVKELSDLKSDSSIIAQPENNKEDRLLEVENIPDKSEEKKEQSESKLKENTDEITDLLTLDTNTADELLNDFLSSPTIEEPPTLSNKVDPTPGQNIFLPSQILSLHQPSKLFSENSSDLTATLNNIGTKNMVQSKPNAWYNLFAELDPLTDPDTVSKTFDSQQRKC